MRRTEAWNGDRRRRRMRAPRILTYARRVPHVTSSLCPTSCRISTTIVDESRRPKRHDIAPLLRDHDGTGGACNTNGPAHRAQDRVSM